MGLFDKFKKIQNNDSAENSKMIAEIFRIICKGKESVDAEIAECTNSTKDYAEKIKYSSQNVVYHLMMLMPILLCG